MLAAILALEFGHLIPRGFLQVPTPRWKLELRWRRWLKSRSQQ
jgi:hypothetical protein